MSRPQIRETVYNVIDGERDYQDNLPPTRRRENRQNSVPEYILMIEEYAAKARRAWNDETGDTSALHQVRKIGALAVACMEAHGWPER